MTTLLALHLGASQKFDWLGHWLMRTPRGNHFVARSVQRCLTGVTGYCPLVATAQAWDQITGGTYEIIPLKTPEVVSCRLFHPLINLHLKSH